MDNNIKNKIEKFLFGINYFDQIININFINVFG